MPPARLLQMSPQSLIRLLGLALLMLAGVSFALDRNHQYRLAGLAGVPSVTDVPFKVVQEAFANLQLALEIVPLPHVRSLQGANDGIYDGNLPRFTYIEAVAPNLRRVPVSLGGIDYVPYVLKGNTYNLSSWEAIKASGLRVGGKFGNRLVETSLGSALTSSNNSYELLLKMLLLRRVDVVIAPSGELEALFATLPPELQERAPEVRQLPPVASEQLYLYLHQRHSELIEPLTRELKRMESKGVIARYWKMRQQQIERPGQ